jgi:branched-chain amino acid aminotransferase
MTLWFESLTGGRYVDPATPIWTAADRGFAYGDGLFETIRVEQKQPVFLDRHLRRLDRGLQAIGLDVPWDNAAFADRCRRVCAYSREDEGVLKLTITRGPGPRGYAPPTTAEPALSVELHPGLLGAPRAAAAVLAPWRIDPAAPLNRLKSLSALDKVLARQIARQAGVDEAILQNTSGHLTEATASNLFILRDGKILTPGENCGLLPGITRELLLEFAPVWGYDRAETNLTKADLAAADEAFLTNTVFELTPLTRFDHQSIGSGLPGPVTMDLSKLYARMRREAVRPIRG